MPHRGSRHHSESHDSEEKQHNNDNNGNCRHRNSSGSGDDDPSITKCCVPSGCHVDQPIRMEDLNDCVKVICNNEQCNQGRYMHKSCFESWEETVLNYLRSTGRARSWSEKQRLQNLWTKKGYDLAYKACSCKCAKGHLRKDLDWTPPVVCNSDNQGKKKKNRKKKSNDKPTLTISTSMSNGASSKHHPTAKDSANGLKENSTSNGHNNNQSSNPVHHPNVNVQVIPMARLRTPSMSSTTSGGSGGSGGTSPPISGFESQSPGFMDHSIFMKKFFGDPTNHHSRYRERHNSGSIFSRRQDYSSFNNLPRHKINSYHIKMEDDVNHGNDETRNFILSTLSANRMNRVPCILCHSSMMIFDKYPLVDGTFFLSPTQHSKGAVPCQLDGRTQYLNAVCMSCLEGWNRILKCKSCGSRWSGSHLILGSMYSYDIFAAVPCCGDRLRCNNCSNIVTTPEHRVRYFSEYSHALPCAHCGVVNHHFAKPLQAIFNVCGRE